ncbi:MAG: hypothetical protein ABIN18_17185 [Pseudomonadota bacterium]
MDYDELQRDFDLTDPEDRRAYDKRYIEKIKELSGGLDNDEQEDVIEEMHTLNYNPSNSPENDAELNWLRGRNIAKQKNRFNPATESYLQHIASEDGKTLAQVKKEYRKIMKGGK